MDRSAQGDIVTFGWHQVRDGALHFQQEKGGKQMRLDLLPQLLQVLAEVPRDQPAFIVTEFGQPFTSNGFGNWFHDRVVEAGLAHKKLSAHGLRKALQTIGSEVGLTDRADGDRRPRDRQGDQPLHEETRP